MGQSFLYFLGLLAAVAVIGFGFFLFTRFEDEIFGCLFGLLALGAICLGVWMLVTQGGVAGTIDICLALAGGFVIFCLFITRKG